MAVFSKPVTLSYTCYEMGHTWTPYCFKASKDVAVACYSESLKIYTSLYVAAAILGRKKKAYWKNKLLPEILQSTLFLGTNGFLFITFFCIWRKLTGFFFLYNAFTCCIPACAAAMCIERKSRKLVGQFYMINSGYLPSLFASFFAILLERKTRRALLAVYMANVATETLYRMGKFRGLFQPIKHGEVLLFSIFSALYCYLFRRPGGSSDSTIAVLKYLLGSSELPATIPNSLIDQRILTPREVFSDSQQSISNNLSKTASWLLGIIRSAPKHNLCKHKFSCADYVLKGFFRTFGTGYVIQGGIKVLTCLIRAFKQPSLLLQAVLHKDNFYLGAFLGSFSVIFRAVNCLLRWCRDRDDHVHGLLAGFVAGWSMLWYKSVTITLTMGSKLAEILYFKGIEANLLPYIKCADVILYSISTALVFHAAVFEPHNLRPAYWKFLRRLTDNHFEEMNRLLIDAFGTMASTMYPDFWPPLDPRFSSLVRPLKLPSS